MAKIFFNKLFIFALFFIFVSLISVFAGNVIVKEGNVEIENSGNLSAPNYYVGDNEDVKINSNGSGAVSFSSQNQAYNNILNINLRHT